MLTAPGHSVLCTSVNKSSCYQHNDCYQAAPIHTCSTIPKITSVDVKETPTTTAKDMIKSRPLEDIDYRSVDTDSKKQPSSNPATLV